MSISNAVPTRSAAGRTISDRYRLITRLAVGGMGEVWIAVDELLDRNVAVKILRDEFLESPLFLARFRAEAKHTAALTHPGVAHIFDYGEEHIGDRCTAYLVMELVDGPPLSDLLAARGPLPIATAIEWLAQTAEALGAAHRMGIVHRDVKPGNLLVAGNTIKVTDFGIAKALNSTPVTDAGQVVGTARYMAPEQATGNEATPASDVYSLGIVGYEMLTGHPPFTEGNPVALATAHLYHDVPPLPQSVPSVVRELIARALAKNPGRRPADADTFARELRTLQHGGPSPASVTSIDSGSGQRHARSLAPTAALETRPAVTRIIDHDLTTIAPPSPGPNAIVSHHRATNRTHRFLAGGLLLVAVIVFALTRQHSSTPQTIPGASSTATQPVGNPTSDPLPTTQASTFLDPAAYLGIPVAQARQRLVAAGFDVAPLLDTPADAVVASIRPNGLLPNGSTVTLVVTVETTAPSAAPTAAVTTTTAATPSRGQSNGNAKGKGKGK